jgi:predicted acyltransferase
MSVVEREKVVRLEVLPGPARKPSPSLVSPPPRPHEAAAPARFVSLDALRGLIILCIIGGDGMALALRDMVAGQGVILRTLGAAIGAQFEHVPWEGVTFYDLIFPLFIFVTGVAIVFSLSRLVEREGKRAAYLRVIRRSLLLFALGVIFYGGFSREWPDIRLLGVLQRIAICYLIASMLFLNLNMRGLLAVCATLLAGYWALMTFVPVPGIGAGVFAPNANLANWIDLNYLPGSKWAGTHDPEGLLSTLPAIATALIGVLGGLLLKETRLSPGQKSLWLIGAGLAMIGAGHLWSLQFPIIKAIWTSSFVLVAGGYSFILLGLFHHVVDVWGWRRWTTVLVWVGANAILVYFLNGIVGFERLAVRLVGGDVGLFLDRLVAPGAGRFVAHAVGLLLAILLAGYLYRRKIFLRV